jgi:hypothetical protein
MDAGGFGLDSTSIFKSSKRAPELSSERAQRARGRQLRCAASCPRRGHCLHRCVCTPAGAPASPRLRLGLPDAARFARGFRPAAGMDPTSFPACVLLITGNSGTLFLRGFMRSAILPACRFYGSKFTGVRAAMAQQRPIVGLYGAQRGAPARSSSSFAIRLRSSCTRDVRDPMPRP